MRYVTRFNPTANGGLHLGHVYVMLFNLHLARSTAGRFLVRFENNTVDSLYSMTGRQMDFHCDRMMEVISWLGIEVDAYERQSEMDQALKEFVAHHGWFIPAFRWPFSIPINPALGDYNPEEGEWYPYAPYLTFCKVIYDELAGVNVLVRGDDLRSEFGLYQHYRRLLGLKQIDHYYLPRICGPNGGIVSKFHQATPVDTFKRAGWQAADIIELLAESALKRPDEGWHLSNVKQNPQLVEALTIQV